MTTKKLAAAAVCAAVLLTAGCSGGNNGSSGGVFSDIQKFTEASGRDYGKSFTAEIGEPLSNSFFTLTVNQAVRLSTLAGYLPDDGYDYLAVNIYTRNIYDQTIPMGIGDYVVRWAEGDDGCDGAFDMDGEDNSYGFEEYPKETYLAVSGNAAETSGWLFFMVPKDAIDLKLEYVELYDDEFEGSTYQINLGNPDFYEKDIKSSYISANAGETIHGDRLDITLDSWQSSDTIETFTADEGYAIVTADVTIKNTSSENIAVGAIDFVIYDSGDLYDYAIEATAENGFTGTYLPVDTTLAAGETISGTIVFSPPEDTEDLYISYYFEYDNGGYDAYEFKLR